MEIMTNVEGVLVITNVMSILFATMILDFAKLVNVVTITWNAQIIRSYVV